MAENPAPNAYQWHSNTTVIPKAFISYGQIPFFVNRPYWDNFSEISGEQKVPVVKVEIKIFSPMEFIDHIKRENPEVLMVHSKFKFPAMGRIEKIDRPKFIDIVETLVEESIDNFISMHSRFYCSNSPRSPLAHYYYEPRYSYTVKLVKRPINRVYWPDLLASLEDDIELEAFRDREDNSIHVQRYPGWRGFIGTLQDTARLYMHRLMRGVTEFPAATIAQMLEETVEYHDPLRWRGQ